LLEKKRVLDKKRLLITVDCSLADGALLPRGTYVWLMETLPDGILQVEYKDRLHVIAADHASPVPIPPPSEDELKRKDPCFGLGLQAFDEIYKDDEWLFSIYRCKAHGAWFLEDVQTGIGWHSRFIFLEQAPDAGQEGYRKTWRRYNQMSDDELNLLKIKNPFPPGANGRTERE